MYYINQVQYSSKYERLIGWYTRSTIVGQCIDTVKNNIILHTIGTRKQQNQLISIVLYYFIVFLRARGILSEHKNTVMHLTGKAACVTIHVSIKNQTE